MIYIHGTNTDFYDSEQKHKGVKAELWGHSYFSVPHPNARVKTKSRNEIWERIGKQTFPLT